MSEASLTSEIKKYLEELPKNEIWFYKASDKFTSGIPDFIGCYLGKFFAIELKDKKKSPTKLQEYIIYRINRSGGQAIWTDNLDDVDNLFKRLRRLTQRQPRREAIKVAYP